MIYHTHEIHENWYPTNISYFHSTWEVSITCLPSTYDNNDVTICFQAPSHLFTQPNEIVQHLTVRKEEFHKLIFPVLDTSNSDISQKVPVNTPDSKESFVSGSDSAGQTISGDQNG